MASDAGTAAPTATAPDRALRIAIDGEPAHLNPDLDPDRWGWRIAWDGIYEPLVRPDGSGGFAPALADRFTVEDEGRVYIFHLRPGVLFSDGEPLTPADVAFTFDRLRSPRTHAPRWQAELADVERVELLQTGVRIWARRPSAYLLAAIADVAILPEHVFGRGELMYQPANRHPVGTGPFRVHTWERGRGIALERNPRWWGPRVNVNSIDIAIDEDATRALGQAHRGELDVVGRVPPSYVPEQIDSPTIRATYDAVRTTPDRFTYVVWNIAHAPLDRVEARRALALAIDRDKLIATVRHRLARTIAAPPVGGPSVSAPPPAFDLVRASALLDGVGADRKDNGARNLPPAGSAHPWRLTLLVAQGRESEAVAHALVDALAKLGVGVDLAIGDLATITLRLKKGAFDGALLEWSGRDDDDLSALFRSGGAQNFGGYGDHAVDNLLDELHRPSPSADARHARFAALQQALADDPPALFLYAPDEVHLLAKRLGAVHAAGDFPSLRELTAP